MKSHYINKAQHAYAIKSDDGHSMGIYHVRTNVFVARSKHTSAHDLIDLAKELEKLAIKHGNISNSYDGWDDY